MTCRAGPAPADGQLGLTSDTEAKKATEKAGKNNAKANAKVDKTCGADEMERAANCPALYTDAPGGTGVAEYPLDEAPDMGTPIQAAVDATCLAPL